MRVHIERHLQVWVPEHAWGRKAAFSWSGAIAACFRQAGMAASPFPRTGGIHTAAMERRGAALSPSLGVP